MDRPTKSVPDLHRRGADMWSMRDPSPAVLGDILMIENGLAIHAVLFPALRSAECGFFPGENVATVAREQSSAMHAVFAHRGDCHWLAPG